MSTNLREVDMQLEDLKEQNHNLSLITKLFMIFAGKAPAGTVKIREASLAALVLTSGWLITILFGSVAWSPSPDLNVVRV